MALDDLNASLDDLAWVACGIGEQRGAALFHHLLHVQDPSHAQ